MLDIVKRFFNAALSDGAGAEDRKSGHDARVATCALFLEMARIDDAFTPAETDFILSILKEKYGLSGEHADALLAEAEAERRESIDYWQFARLINENYSIDEKLEIIEILWQIVFVDGKMDRYENYLMHKLGDLLRLTHHQLMEAKLNVLHSR